MLARPEIIGQLDGVCGTSGYRIVSVSVEKVLVSPLTEVAGYGGPVLAFALALLVLCIRGVIRTTRQSLLHRLPVRERQQVAFAEPGRVVLWLQGPQLTGRFGQLEAELVGPYGTPAAAHQPLMRLRASGAATTSMAWLVFDISVQGDHVLWLGGVQAGTDSPTSWSSGGHAWRQPSPGCWASSWPVSC